VSRSDFFPGEPVFVAQAAGPYAYVGSDDRDAPTIRIIDLRSGEIVGEAGRARGDRSSGVEIVQGVNTGLRVRLRCRVRLRNVPLYLGAQRRSWRCLQKRGKRQP
jgi:hypothetical protein